MYVIDAGGRVSDEHLYSICFYLIFVSPDMLRKVVYDTYEISGGGNSWLPLIQNGRVNVHPAARLHRSSRSDE